MKEPLYKFQDETIWMMTYHDTCDTNYDETTLSKKPTWVKKQKILLKTPEEVKMYYGDKTKSIYVERVTLVVEESDKSISLKLYNYSKGRKVGTSYFGTTRRVQYITFNKKYKNFYSGLVIRGKKKTKGNIVRCNNWFHIQGVLSDIVSSVNEVSLSGGESCNLDTKHGWNTLKESVSTFNKTLSEDITYGDITELSYSYFNFYNQVNGFKMPNNPYKFISTGIKKSFLRKHTSMVSSYMKMYDMRGKKVRLILNSKKYVNFNSLHFFYDLLGVDYFNQVNLSFELDSEHYSTPNTFINDKFNITNNEKKCLIGYINDYCQKTVDITNNGNLITFIRDHLRFKDKLKEYGVNVKVSATTKDEFNKEHNEWVNTLESYENGVIVRNYPKMMIEEIEKPIIGNHIDYYPVLLMNSDHYNDESNHQKNCVRTYVESPNCFIVSIREGGIDGKERATVEFRYFKGRSPEKVQSLGRFNENLNSDWNYVLEEMGNRINGLSDKWVIELPKMKKIYPNGKFINRQAYWNQKRLVWDNTEEIKDDIFDFIP